MINKEINGQILRWSSKKIRVRDLASALLLLSILFAMVLPLRAAAFTEWYLPAGTTGPYELVLDNQSPKNVWFAAFHGDTIGRLNPGSGEIREIVLPPNSRPWGIAFDRTRNEVWFTETGRNKLGRITSYGASVTEYMPSDSAALEGPRGITVQEFVNGTDKPYIWFTEFGADRISRLDPEDEYQVKYWQLASGSGPQSIVFSNDIGIWFTEFGSHKIGNLNPLTDTIIEYFVDVSSTPWDLAIDAYNNVWYTDPGRNMISELNPYTGELKEYRVPSTGSNPYSIVIDSKGWVWFAEHSGNKIGRFVPDDNTFTEYQRTSGSSVWGLALPQGSDIIWFTDDSALRIGRFESAIAITTTTASTISTASVSTTTIPLSQSIPGTINSVTTVYADASTTVTFATTTQTTSYQATEVATVVLTTVTTTTTTYSSETIVVLGTSTSYTTSIVGTSTTSTTTTQNATATSVVTTSGTKISTVLSPTTTTVYYIVTTSLPRIPGYPVGSIAAGIVFAAILLGALSRTRRTRKKIRN